jgi:hypothetical protein
MKSGKRSKHDPEARSLALYDPGEALLMIGTSESPEL